MLISRHIPGLFPPLPIAAASRAAPTESRSAGETSPGRCPAAGRRRAIGAPPVPARTIPAALSALPSARPPASHEGEKRRAPGPGSIGTTRRPPWTSPVGDSRQSCGHGGCFSALSIIRFLPSTVRGPVDLRALARLAASKAGVTVGRRRKDIVAPKMDSPYSLVPGKPSQLLLVSGSGARLVKKDIMTKAKGQRTLVQIRTFLQTSIVSTCEMRLWRLLRLVRHIFFKIVGIKQVNL